MKPAAAELRNSSADLLPTDQASVLNGLAMCATDLNNAGQIIGWTHFVAGYRSFIAVPIKR